MGKIAVYGFIDDKNLSKLDALGMDIVATDKQAFLAMPVYHQFVHDYIMNSNLDSKIKSLFQSDSQFRKKFLDDLHQRLHQAEHHLGHIGTDTVYSMVDDSIKKFRHNFKKTISSVRHNKHFDVGR